MPPNPFLKRYDQIILFGDSITEWSTDVEAGFAFQPALQWLYCRRLDVINRGFSGYNTQHAVHALPQFMPTPDQARVRLLVVFFGANDAVLPSDPDGQHVPLVSYKQNLIDIVEHTVVQEHKPEIVLVTPPPIDEQHLIESGFPPGSRLAEVTAQYARTAREVAEERGIPCCDLWTAMMLKATHSQPVSKPIPGDIRAPRNEVLREMLVDGLHFTPMGYEMLFDCIRDVILQHVPSMDPQKLPSVFPPWREAPKAKQSC